MLKRKVQTTIFYCDNERIKHFLLLKMNKKRGLYWQNVTGGVEKNEDFEEAALREAKEETGLKKKNIKKLTYLDFEFQFHDQWGNDVLEKVYALEVAQPWDILIDPSEHCEYKWVAETDIHPKIVHFETNFQAIKKVLQQ